MTTETTYDASAGHLKVVGGHVTTFVSEHANGRKEFGWQVRCTVTLMDCGQVACTTKYQLVQAVTHVNASTCILRMLLFEPNAVELPL